MSQAKRKGTYEQRVMQAMAKNSVDKLDLYAQTWLHGTNTVFERFEFPPPQKKGDELSVPHTGVFLTLHRDYAESAGQGLCSAKLRSSARVLDLTYPSKESETLRREVCKNHNARHSIYINNSVQWIEGWRTGDVLRVAIKGTAALPWLGAHVAQLVSAGMSEEVAWINTQHNLTRGLIELICESARQLGFDAIYGHEVDRHSGSVKIARPWLAVLNDGALFPIEWIRRPTWVVQLPTATEADSYTEL
jgi:hypothetical protein